MEEEKEWCLLTGWCALLSDLRGRREGMVPINRLLSSYRRIVILPTKQWILGSSSMTNFSYTQEDPFSHKIYQRYRILDHNLTCVVSGAYCLVTLSETIYLPQGRERNEDLTLLHHSRVQRTRKRPALAKLEDHDDFVITKIIFVSFKQCLAPIVILWVLLCLSTT